MAKPASKANTKEVVTKVEIKQVLDVPEDKLNEYKEAFDMFDKDHSGNISIDELYQVMKNMGNEISMEEIKSMVADLDEDNSGEIDFKEFITFCKRVETVENLTEEEEVIRAFKTFDKDGSGTLSCSEFKHILCNLGDKFTEEEVMEIFNEADLNHDGELNYAEFVSFWKDK